MRICASRHAYQSWLRPSSAAVSWQACSAASPAALSAVRRPQHLLLPPARFLSSGAGGHGEGSQGNRKAQAAVLAVGTVGVAWLTFEDRRGGLSGGPFEPLTLYVAAIVRGSRAAVALVRVAADYKISLRGLEKSTDEYRAALAECHSRAAQSVLQLCRQQAGVYIKAGQLLASLRPVLPQQFTETLAQLCDDAPRSPLHDVRRVFREEMGADMEQIFHHVDPEPIGCASLAQVHKAWLRQDDGGEGRMVALKVQHAWMSRHTRSDTLVMEAAASILELLFPAIEIKWLIPVFRRNLESELNFLSEARNMQRCAFNFQDMVGVRVPTLLEHLTSRRILTMEFINGVKVNDVDSLRARGFDPVLVASNVTRIFGEMVFCHGFVHCDPHPGNMLVVPRHEPAATAARGRGKNEFDVVVLDHGLYREISPAMRRGYCEMWEAMILQDSAMLQRVATDMGVGQYAKLFPLIFTMRAIDSQVKLGDRMSKDERERVRDNLGVEGFSKDNFNLAEVLHFSERIPRDLLFIIRTQNLVRALCSDLGLESRQRFRLYASLAARGKVLVHTPIPPHLAAFYAPSPAHHDTQKGVDVDAYRRVETESSVLASGDTKLQSHTRPDTDEMGRGFEKEGVGGGVVVSAQRSAGTRARQWLRSLNLEFRMLLIEMGMWLYAVFWNRGRSAGMSASLTASRDSPVG